MADQSLQKWLDTQKATFSQQTLIIRAAQRFPMLMAYIPINTDVKYDMIEVAETLVQLEEEEAAAMALVKEKEEKEREAEKEEKRMEATKEGNHILAA
jgi:hypothetical protein